jgi:hypothetical protein
MNASCGFFCFLFRFETKNAAVSRYARIRMPAAGESKKLNTGTAAGVSALRVTTGIVFVCELFEKKPQIRNIRKLPPDAEGEETQPLNPQNKPSSDYSYSRIYLSEIPSIHSEI